MGIGRLPPPRPHLGPRCRRLLRHGSLALLRLRVEHLHVTDKNQQQPRKNSPGRKGKRNIVFNWETEIGRASGWYLGRRWAAEVRLLHAASATEHRREEAGELHVVPVLQRARAPSVRSQSVSALRLVKLAGEAAEGGALGREEELTCLADASAAASRLRARGKGWLSPPWRPAAAPPCPWPCPPPAPVGAAEGNAKKCSRKSSSAPPGGGGGGCWPAMAGDGERGEAHASGGEASGVARDKRDKESALGSCWGSVKARFFSRGRGGERRRGGMGRGPLLGSNCSREYAVGWASFIKKKLIVHSYRIFWQKPAQTYLNCENPSSYIFVLSFFLSIIFVLS